MSAQKTNAIRSSRRTDMYQNPFSKLIHSQREKLGFSIETICQYLNCHPTSIRKWDNGDYLPKHETVIKFAELHQIDLNVFNQLYRELQESRGTKEPKLAPELLFKPLSDEEIEDMINQADRYILFTKKQVAKLIKQVEIKHGLRSDIE